MIISGKTADICPDKLYKYYSLNEQKVQTIVNNKLWLSSPCDFNDPFEFGASIDTRDFEAYFSKSPSFFKLKHKKEKYREFEQEYLKAKAEAERKLLSAIEDAKKSFSICCFTEKYDNLLMWSHYADGHKGVCIEYDLTSQPALKLFIERVHYATELFQVSEQPRENRKILIHKSDVWSYEKEWRLVLSKESLGEHEAPAVRSIYFGAKASMDSPLNQVLYRYAQENNMKLYHME